MVVKTAFLNGDLKDKIYMEQPEEFTMLEEKHLVCQLHRALYGLKQASRSWYIKNDQFLTSQGFVSCISDPNIYIKRNGDNHFVILALYVDDTILVSNNLPFM